MELAGERREAQLRGRQGRLAFAYLVLHRDRPVRRDELIEALWAHEGAPPSDTALAPVLSRLRRAIEPAVLEGRDTLRLVFPEPVWVDVEAIRGFVAAARDRGRQRRAGRADARRARAAARPRRAVAASRAQRPRRAPDRGAGAGRARRPRRTPSAAGRGRPPAAIAAPFRESSRAALIEVLMQRGNLAEAVRAYDEHPRAAARGARHDARP